MGKHNCFRDIFVFILCSLFLIGPPPICVIWWSRGVPTLVEVASRQAHTCHSFCFTPVTHPSSAAFKGTSQLLVFLPSLFSGVLCGPPRSACLPVYYVLWLFIYKSVLPHSGSAICLSFCFTNSEFCPIPHCLCLDPPLQTGTKQPDSMDRVNWLSGMIGHF